MNGLVHGCQVLEAMDITSNAVRIRLAAFQLEGESQVGWNWANTSRDVAAMTWTEFHGLASISRPLLDMQRPKSS